MRKELTEIKQHVLAAIGIPVVCFAVAICVYSSFDAVRDPRIEDTSLFWPCILICLVGQGLASIASRKPCFAIPFIWIIAFPFAALPSFISSGPRIWGGFTMHQRMEQVVELRVFFCALLPIIVATICHVYLRLILPKITRTASQPAASDAQ